MKTVAILFLLMVFIHAVGCIVFPHKIVEYRQKRKWSESVLSGGYFYATPYRTRLMGTIHLVVILVVFVFGVILT